MKAMTDNELLTLCFDALVERVNLEVRRYDKAYESLVYR